MLSPEKNERLTRVGAGTPMGRTGGMCTVVLGTLVGTEPEH